MEPAIIAALVAGTVSLAGLIVQLLIARQSRIAQREALANAAQIELSKSVVSGMRSLENETESLRILAWQALAIMDDMPSDFLARDDENVDRLIKCATRLSAESAEFLESWAAVKYDIDDEFNDYLRKQRHECRHLISGMRAIVERINREVRSQSLSPATRDYFVDLETHLQALLPQLDRFGRGIAVARQKLVPATDGG